MLRGQGGQVELCLRPLTTMLHTAFTKQSTVPNLRHLPMLGYVCPTKEAGRRMARHTYPFMGPESPIWCRALPATVEWKLENSDLWFLVPHSRRKTQSCRIPTKLSQMHGTQIYSLPVRRLNDDGQLTQTTPNQICPK